ncbi:MAG: 2-amino-4-hydroxy-6-hydroxymethyldihydropteridine diphosphokinase [Elusimicrobia bacterium]|nr:2-amino-4-hydroxy-6-hydroxymethyldihydropteridine diphosphokinase [Elusimicrobiota bacterium]
MALAYLLLGSNVGNRRRYLRAAAGAVKGWAKTTMLEASSVWETRPEGFLRQRAFFNQAVAIETRLEPAALLIWAKKTELELGRRKRRRWGPREIDMDILLYGRRRVRRSWLVIPHPRLHRRAFALKPLAELCPRMTHPVLGERIAVLAERLPSDAVRRLDD